MIGRVRALPPMLCAVVATGTIFLMAGPANAGGTWLEFERESYRPGDEVRAEATVYRGQLGWVEDGPFHARLRAGHGYRDVEDPQRDVILGPVTLTNETKTSVGVTVDFTVPDVPAGEWWVMVCDEDCEEGLGDLIGGTLKVGTASFGAADALPRTGDRVSPLLGAALALMGLGVLSLARSPRSDGEAGG